MDQWYKIDFTLEDFGRHTAQLFSKEYTTFPFFTPTQVYYAMIGKESMKPFERYDDDDLLKPCTVAVPTTNLETTSKIYSIRTLLQYSGDREFSKKFRFPTYGKIELIKPGTQFTTYSTILPKGSVIFIGKKRPVARINDKKEVDAVRRKKIVDTAIDLLPMQLFNKLSPSQYSIHGISKRWICGSFRVKEALFIDEKPYISPLLQLEME